MSAVVATQTATSSYFRPQKSPQHLNLQAAYAPKQWLNSAMRCLLLKIKPLSSESEERGSPTWHDRMGSCPAPWVVSKQKYFGQEKHKQIRQEFARPVSKRRKQHSGSAGYSSIYRLGHSVPPSLGFSCLVVLLGVNFINIYNNI